MFFLGAGALMIPVWLRVGSVDMALAEAALGTGVLTALLLGLALPTPAAPRTGADGSAATPAAQSGR